MTARALRVRAGTYVDSVRLMGVSRQLRERQGVTWAAAAMATPANREELAAQGFTGAHLGDAGADDLVLAVVAIDDAAAQTALDAAEAALDEGDGHGGGRPGGGALAGEAAPRTLMEALERLDGANLALISVPGDYAALEAHKALSAGLHVLLFSDNVPLGDEVALKHRARDAGLLLMGPGAGTAALAGVGLGFANVTARGRVGVVAAAGTGAQEMMVLLDRWGAGVSHVIGLGGRDLSTQVGGLMALNGIEALAADQDTDLIVLVSKPPATEVAEQVLGALRGRPAVAALIGLGEDVTAPEGVVVVDGLEAGARAAVERLGLPAPAPATGLAAAAAAVRLPDSRRAVRGLYSGGTLCYEALVTLSRHLGPVYSNTPLRPGWALPAPDGAHVCLDLGEEEYTRGRPHPMIDPQARVEAIAEAAADPSVAVIVLDVVLGHGSHPDPAGALAPALAAVRDADDAPVVVAYVLGSEGDPQGLASQRERLESAGCVLAPTAQRAALLAGAIAARRPDLAEE